MRFHPRLFPCLLLSVALSAPAFAQTDGTLRVLRPSMRTEQDRPELCLEFDHPLDADTGHVLGALRLEADGKNIPLAAQAVNVAGANLCLSNLDYRRDYRLAITGLHGSGGEKLTETYRLSFTIPDRRAALSFATDRDKDGMLRWNENDPVLHGVNAPRAKIEVYKITDPARMAEAWQQRGQTALVPTESAYFARHNGKLLWQSDIVLSDAPNKVQEQTVPLRAALGGDPAPGLYLIVASAPDVKTRDDQMAPLAAQWLLRSDLSVRALRGLDHVYAIADREDGGAPVRDAHILLENTEQETLAEGRSDADGVADLSVAADKMGDAATLLGLTASGDAAFADLTQKENADFVLPDFAAAVTPGKAFYAPGDTATVTLTAHDAHGRSAPPSDSQLDIRRPGGGLYASLPVPPGKNGEAQLPFAVPAGNGNWKLEWRRKDGTKLAESDLRITANDEAPRIEAGADRAMLGHDGKLVLTLTSLTIDNRPAPYIAGHITMAWESPDHIFPGWDGYRFGNGQNGAPGKSSDLASFITDSHGLAQIPLTLPPPPSGALLHDARIGIASDPAAGAADPAPLQVPVRPDSFIVGIRPAAADGKFAENSAAHFDVVALDPGGKRVAANGLGYRVYEEGRSFEWYQTDGHWNYKPEPQERRIASGALSIKADAPAAIDWRGSAGNYRLEITDGGAVLARMDFNAGWGTPETASTPSAPLDLTSPPSALRPGMPAMIGFRLDKDAMVTAVIADDHIRDVIHRLEKAGHGAVSFIPESGWGERVKISIEADAVNNGGKRFAGQVIVPMETPAKSGKESLLPHAAEQPALAVDFPPAPILTAGDKIRLSAAVKNNAASTASYHYMFTAPPGLRLWGEHGGTVNLTKGQSRNLAVTLEPLRPGTYEVRMETAGPHNFHANYSWPLVAAAEPGLAVREQVTLKPKESWPPKKEKKAARSENGFLFIAPQPLFDAPAILAAALNSHPFTTNEIADDMDFVALWREAIIRAGLMPEPELAMRRRTLALQLVERQMPDGGFPSLPGGEADMADTAVALTALSGPDLPFARPAADHAAAWLKQRLDNNWFDEKERPARAAAYAAMTAAGRLDAASLHYFSDTSSGKDLPPLAALQLSAAFAHINDGGKSDFWLKKAHIGDNSPDIEPALLPWLAANPGFDPHALLPALEKLSGTKGGKPPQNSAAALFLNALWKVGSREGIWRVTLNKGEQNVRNVFITPLGEKTLTVHNPGDKPLYLIDARAGKSPAAKGGAISRRIFRMDGSELTAEKPLKQGEIYLVVAEGPWPGGARTLFVHDFAGPALTPVSCALGHDPESDESLKWIGGLSLTSPAACEAMPGGVDILLSSANGAKTWRVAYLAEASWRGDFTFAPVEMRAPGNHGAEKSRGERHRVD